MRVLLITLGSHGDTHPYMAIARELQQRGHEAVLLTNPYFQKQIERAGLRFAPIGDNFDIAEAMATPGVMDPMKGARVVLKELTLPHVPQFYHSTQRLLAEFKPDAAVIHPICFGAHWACDQAGVPVVAGILAPIGWMESDDPIVFGPWRSHNPSPWLSRLDAWVGRLSIRFMLDGPLNRIRRELGLPKSRDFLVREFVRPGLNLGLWSSRFRGPAKGDPEGSVICGFPWFDAHHDHEHDWTAIEEFLNAGEPPLVFTLGTAAVHVPGHDFYACALEAARLLGRRAVLLIGKEEYRARLGTLPDGVRAFAYAPFSKLLPRAAATVHHGGIGSTAQGLKSGRPTVIVPLAHDQFDNAARAKRLGISETLFFKRVTGPGLAKSLRMVLESKDAGERAKRIAVEIRAENGARAAVEALEKTLSGAVSGL